MEDDIRRHLDGCQFDEAFGLLLERFQEKVFRLAFSMTRNETLAGELAQDIFVKIWKALPGYHGGACPSTWIYAIARNTCLTELKRNSAHPTVSLQEPGMEGAADRFSSLQCGDPEPGAEMDAESLLAQLPENYRRVVVLFYLEQKSYEEVAVMLGCPLGTVKTLLFRAKKELLRIGSRSKQAAPTSRLIHRSVFEETGGQAATASLNHCHTPRHAPVQAGDGVGVRPSPGAATSELPPSPANSEADKSSRNAAPEDGRTPSLTHYHTAQFNVT